MGAYQRCELVGGLKRDGANRGVRPDGTTTGNVARFVDGLDTSISDFSHLQLQSPTMIA